MTFTVDDFAKALGERYDGDRTDADLTDADGGEPSARPTDDPRWRTLIRDTFTRLTRGGDSAGFTDEDRARNYVALKDSAVYALMWNALGDGRSLVDVSARRVLRAGRRTVAVRLTFRHRQTQVVECYERLVDTHDVFCFAIGSLTPAYD